MTDLPGYPTRSFLKGALFWAPGSGERATSYRCWIGDSGGDAGALRPDLVPAGRVPNTAGIGFDKTGIELDERGFLKVNERQEAMEFVTRPNGATQLIDNTLKSLFA